MKRAGRAGLAARLATSSPWGRLAAAGAGLFFLIVIVAGMGAALAPVGATACDPGALTGSVREVPRRYARLYLDAAERFRLGARGPAILAAIHKEETDFGRSPSPGVRSGTNAAGAAGPMQFLPSTWRRYGVDGDGDGVRDVYDPADAIFGAANYLHASGAPGDWYGAIFAYNHADWYVGDVLGYARRFGDVGEGADASCAPTGGAELGRAVRLEGPRAFRPLPAPLMAPGYPREQVDARLLADALWILRTYDLRVTAAREAGHHTHGDGTALDMVPAGDLSSQAVWDRSAGRLAADLGWRSACGSSGSRQACPLVPAIQFIGYDGYPGHGSPRTCRGDCPAHIHVSWVSSSFGSASLSPPARWVLAFPVPGTPS